MQEEKALHEGFRTFVHAVQRKHYYVHDANQLEKKTGNMFFGFVDLSLQIDFTEEQLCAIPQ